MDENGNAHSWSALASSMRRHASEVRGFARAGCAAGDRKDAWFGHERKTALTPANRGGSLYDRGWYDVGRLAYMRKARSHGELHAGHHALRAEVAGGTRQARVCAGRRAGAPLCTDALQHGDGDERLYHSGRTARACGDGAGASGGSTPLVVGPGSGIQPSAGCLFYPCHRSLCLPAGAVSAPWAASTRKARMKPCDMSNPKYRDALVGSCGWASLASSLPRPRQTLLEHLDGNAAFFDDAGRQKAKEKRQRQKAMALA